MRRHIENSILIEGDSKNEIRFQSIRFGCLAILRMETENFAEAFTEALTEAIMKAFSKSEAFPKALLKSETFPKTLTFSWWRAAQNYAIV